MPPELDAFVQRATRRDPEARPADAAAMLAELRAARRGAGGAAGARARAAAEAGRGAAPRCPHAAPPPVRGGTRTCSNATSTPSSRRGRRAGAPPQPSGVRAVDRARRWCSRCSSALVGVVARQRALDDRAVAHRGAAGRRRAPAHGHRPGARHAARLRRGRAGRRGHGHGAELGAPRCCGAAPSPSSVSQRAPDGARRSPRAPPSADAQDAIRAAQLTPVQSGSEYSSSVPEGAVVRTNPAAGTPLPAGQPGDARGEPRRRAAERPGAGAVPDRPPVRRGRGDPGRPRPGGRGEPLRRSAGTTAGWSTSPTGRAAWSTAARRSAARFEDRAGSSRAASRPPGTPAPGPAGCSAAGRRRSRSGPPGRRRRSPARRRGTR